MEGELAALRATVEEQGRVLRKQEGLLRGAEALRGAAERKETSFVVLVWLVPVGVSVAAFVSLCTFYSVQYVTSQVFHLPFVLFLDIVVSFCRLHPLMSSPEPPVYSTGSAGDGFFARTLLLALCCAPPLFWLLSRRVWILLLGVLFPG